MTENSSVLDAALADLEGLREQLGDLEAVNQAGASSAQERVQLEAIAVERKRLEGEIAFQKRIAEARAAAAPQPPTPGTFTPPETVRAAEPEVKPVSNKGATRAKGEDE